MPRVKFTGHKNNVRHPSKPAYLEAGDEFDAPALWLSQHQSYVNNGALEPAKAKKKPASKKAAKKKADK